VQVGLLGVLLLLVQMGDFLRLTQLLPLAGVVGVVLLKHLLPMVETAVQVVVAVMQTLTTQ
jgi:hypothetical protein